MNVRATCEASTAISKYQDCQAAKCIRSYKSFRRRWVDKVMRNSREDYSRASLQSWSP